MQAYTGKNRTPSSVKFEDVLKKLIDIFSQNKPEFAKDRAMRFYLTPKWYLDRKSPYQMVKEGKGKKVMKLLDMMDWSKE